MSIVLYHMLISTCSQKVRLMLAEKELAFESVNVNPETGELLSDWYLALNPNGVVPTLVHDDVPIIDSSVICEYLEEVFPEPSLSPGSAVGRATMRSWMRYFEEVPTAAVRVPSFNFMAPRSFKSLSGDAFEAYTDRMPLRKHFYRGMGEDGFDDTILSEAMDKLRSCFLRVEKELSDGRLYLLGDDFSIADILLVPSIVRLDDLGHQHLWSNLAGVTQWYRAIQQRPSFDQVYGEGSRIDVDRYHINIVM